MSIVIALIEAIKDRGTFDDYTRSQNLDALLNVLKGEVKDQNGKRVYSPVEETIWNSLNLSGLIDRAEHCISTELSLVGKPPETPLL